MVMPTRCADVVLRPRNGLSDYAEPAAFIVSCITDMGAFPQGSRTTGRFGGNLAVRPGNTPPRIAQMTVEHTTE